MEPPTDYPFNQITDPTFYQNQPIGSPREGFPLEEYYPPPNPLDLIISRVEGIGDSVQLIATALTCATTKEDLTIVVDRLTTLLKNQTAKANDANEKLRAQTLMLGTVMLSLNRVSEQLSILQSAVTKLDNKVDLMEQQQILIQTGLSQINRIPQQTDLEKDEMIEQIIEPSRFQTKSNSREGNPEGAHGSESETLLKADSAVQLKSIGQVAHLKVDHRVPKGFPVSAGETFDRKPFSESGLILPGSKQIQVGLTQNSPDSSTGSPTGSSFSPVIQEAVSLVQTGTNPDRGNSTQTNSLLIKSNSSLLPTIISGNPFPEIRPTDPISPTTIYDKSVVTGSTIENRMGNTWESGQLPGTIQVNDDQIQIQVQSGSNRPIDVNEIITEGAIPKKESFQMNPVMDKDDSVELINSQKNTAGSSDLSNPINVSASPSGSNMIKPDLNTPLINPYPTNFNSSGLLPGRVQPSNPSAFSPSTFSSSAVNQLPHLIPNSSTIVLPANSNATNALLGGLPGSPNSGLLAGSKNSTSLLVNNWTPPRGQSLLPQTSPVSYSFNGVSSSLLETDRNSQKSVSGWIPNGSGSPILLTNSGPGNLPNK